MTMTFTDSKNKHPFNRIYERLRKRSYRMRGWGEIHRAYVKGLHDALTEVDRKK